MSGLTFHWHAPFGRLFAVAFGFTACLGLSLILACAPTARRAERDFSRLTIADLQREINSNVGKLKTLRGVARISFESPSAGFAANSQIAVRLPDSASIKLEALFGLDVASLVIFGQSFAVYVPSEKRVYKGSLDHLRYLEPFGLSLEGQVLLRALTGLVPLPAATTHLKGADHDGLLLEAEQEEGVYRYWVEPHHRLVCRVEFVDAELGLLYRLSFSRFARTSGIVLPQMVTLERPQSGERVTLFYVQRALNVDPRTLKVGHKLPAGVEEVVL
ncbi:MAG: DUF4292 domain-containing protein [candidate division KSB1 bacterium]|nr:DUF4292 domain-containing protein [candidate division KSB1 bacterium]MDZ7294888.1 DUF4292 domain-containing protein [candidate division KSB1 bacterium]MDZ7377749.1 DUF4292 domain-containing protein [candidate division KSB1 bacterium]MDZ7393235.1 DUF4292 domain-containing protein [candidate division KSB1 bacterium]MDZ7412455.1 DUF4292 domain-containing protein [candidate division KSB1 bacterium]